MGNQKGQKEVLEITQQGQQSTKLLPINKNEFLGLPEVKESSRKVRAIVKHVQNGRRMLHFFVGPKTIEKQNNSTKQSIDNKSRIVLR